MSRTKARLLGAVFILAAFGCERRPESATTSQPTAKAAAGLLAPEAANWTQPQASERLADEKLGLSAAVQLVRLAGEQPLWLPQGADDAHLRTLRIVQLSPQRWALGLADARCPQRLRAPVLISATGDVQRLADGPQEEALVLEIATDPDVFPHLLVAPARVSMLRDDILTAIALEQPERVRFELRKQNGYSYIALVLTEPGAAEAARYTWEYSERVFIGPAIDSLPDPPGGKFHIDLKASRALIPQGGELPPPKQNVEPPPPTPVELAT